MVIRFLLKTAWSASGKIFANVMFGPKQAGDLRKWREKGGLDEKKMYQIRIVSGRVQIVFSEKFANRFFRRNWKTICETGLFVISRGWVVKRVKNATFGTVQTIDLRTFLSSWHLAGIIGESKNLAVTTVSNPEKSWGYGGTCPFGGLRLFKATNATHYIQVTAAPAPSGD